MKRNSLSGSKDNFRALHKYDILYERLCRLLEEERLYLRPQLKVEDIARAAASNRTYISAALRSKSVTLPELVNSYRARYALDIIIRSDCRDLPVEELAELSGFNSARTMNRYIKKSAGVSAGALRYRLYGPGRKVPKVQPL
ncbi:MAG: hypothetical protein KBT00_06265 [Bacteroidales bacterium]|nr:hypothetical protein [Candidatus Cacconaster merdequi]